MTLKGQDQDDGSRYLEYLTGALADPDVLGSVLNQLLKVDAAADDPTPRGVVRPEPDMATGARRLSTLLGDRYQMRPFVEAFAVMTAGQSIRVIAETTGLPRSVVHRLRTGEDEPTNAHLVLIAKAYGRPPQWFVEYRSGMLAAAVERQLRDQPETSAAICGKLT